MSNPIHIAPGLSMPLQLVTQIISIIARRGAGKTHTAVVMAEELLAAHMQVVVLDPLGVWWGLRSSVNGKDKGFPVVVFGGDHGDVPLTENMGAQVADVIVNRGLSAVVDVSLMTKSAARRFATTFAEQLYDAKRPEDKRTPLHLFIDEADLFMPQRVQPDQARMLGAFEMFPRRGRIRGFGVTTITQRPATLNKDVLTQAEVLITLQLTGPQDRKAVQEWVDAHDDGHRDEFMQSLASLQMGEAWVWSPSWLKIFKRVKIRQRGTFDSSRTPTAGEVVKGPKARADIDLDALRTDMKSVLEQAEQNDPQKLKQRIYTLERELAKKQAPTGASAADVQEIVHKELQARDEAWHTAITTNEARLREEVGATFRRLLSRVPAKTRATIALASGASKPMVSMKPTNSVVHQVYPKSAPLNQDHSILGTGERKILITLAQAGRPRSQAYIAVASNYAQSGTFSNYLSSLRTKGYIQGRGDHIEITEAGKDALGHYQALPVGPELVDLWCSRLGGGEAKILRVLVEAYPNALSSEEIGQQAEYAMSGTFSNYLSTLRTLRLIEGRGAEIRASRELMGSE